MQSLMKAIQQTGLAHTSRQFIHGAATASAIGPDRLDIEDILTVIFPQPAKKMPATMEELGGQIENEFSSLEESIEQQLAKETFAPLLSADGESTTSSGRCREWCKGFMMAVGLLGEEWQQLDGTDDEETLLAIAMLADPQSLVDEKDMQSKTFNKTADDVAELLPDLVYGLFDYWCDELDE